MSPQPTRGDKRIPAYIQAAERFQKGDFELEVPTAPPDEVGRLGQALSNLGRALETRYNEISLLDSITSQINEGLLLDDILEHVYREFRQVIPYDRIGFSLLENDGKIVRARWAKTNQPVVHLYKGFAAAMAGSSLETIMTSGEPRIINDLEEYLVRKPLSVSTRLIVAEGIRSSLTCPLIANGVPVGFIFFSSVERGAYANAHIEVFKRIAGQLSVIVEKGRLVSELADQKAAIESQNEELRRLNEMKNRFLGMAAHDLRNPLATIQMTSTLLAENSAQLTDAQRKSFLEDIIEQSRYMIALLNDLLDVSQIEAGKLNLDLKTFVMRDFIAEIIGRHDNLAKPKRTTVTLDECASGEVVADPLRLRQVMDNLISNGVKYSPPGSVVRVRAVRAGEGWKVTVQDQGPGISESDHKKMFQDFARLSASPTGGEKSTGLGLAITRRVVQAHGGEIGVDSEPGRGATFWFTLSR